MMEWKEILLRLVIASLFGALIGLERERKDWVAGLRTHMMVSVGSCLIMIVSIFGFSDILGTENVSLDPSRIAAQVVSGIGFIGAGAILFIRQGTVRGLTTAAGLWTVAGIGLATGGGLYFAAGATTVIAFIILWALQPLEKYYSKRFKHQSLEIITSLEADSHLILKRLLEEKNLIIQSISIEKDQSSIRHIIKFDKSEPTDAYPIIAELQKIKQVQDVYWSQ